MRLNVLGLIAEYEDYLKDHLGGKIDLYAIAEWAEFKARLLRLVAENEEDGE